MYRFPTCLLLLLLCGPVHAQVARTIRYDGRLERGGRAVDDDVTLEFSIHDAARPGEGAQLWPPQGHHPMPVHVTAGQFFVELGGDGAALPAAVFAASSLFVETVVDGVTLTPRRSIGAVPFAVRADNGVPPGTIISWGGDVAGGVPGGWLLCDGRGASSADYPELFRGIRQSWGNGTNHCPAGAVCDFNVPDLRGRFLRGAGPPGDGHGGEDVSLGAYQGDATRLPNAGFTAAEPGSAHQHDIETNLNYANVVGGASDILGGHRPGHWTPLPQGEHTHAIVGGDTETRPKAYGVSFLVKY